MIFLPHSEIPARIWQKGLTKGFEGRRVVYHDLLAEVVLCPCNCSRGLLSEGAGRRFLFSAFYIR